LFSIWSEDVWVSDAATGKRQHVIKLDDPGRPDTFQSAVSMQLSADGKTLVTFSHYYSKGGGPRPLETRITAWDTATRQQLFRRSRPDTDSMALSPDAQVLATP